MKNFLVLILLSISSLVNSGELPATINITCSESNDCKIKFNLKDEWKVYGHDENNNESLNFAVNEEKSKNVESIEIDWDSQKVYSEDVSGMKVDYYDTNADINFKLFTKDENYKLVLDVNYAACNKYCTVFKDKVIYNGHNTLNDLGWLHIFIMAILGGLILNCMPCVLPIVWLKVMYISKKCKKDIGKTRSEIFFIFLGIIMSFGLLALMTIILRDMGHVVGWGMHFQQPAFVGFIAILTALGTINMLGLFHLQPPQFIQGVLDKADGKVGDFFHGVFIVLLATPCTAPFLGTAVAFCLTQPSEIILLVYLAIGFGLSLPYLILALLPSCLKILPKPGKWMEKFRIATAIPFAGTSFWMFYVLYKQSPYAALVLMSIVSISIGIYNVRLSLLSLVILCGIYIGSSMTTTSVEWKDFKVERISQEVQNGKVVLVNITSEWCITCKVNEKMVFSDESILRELKKRDIVMITGDYTSNSKVITDFIKSKNRAGIPLSVVYGPGAPNGIVLPVILTKMDLVKAIDMAVRM